MDPFEQKDLNDSRNEGEESYSFIEEHVRKRPFDRRKFLWGALRLLLSAIVFGAVAGFVFLLVTGDDLSRSRAELARLTEAPGLTGSPEAESSPVLSGPSKAPAAGSADEETAPKASPAVSEPAKAADTAPDSKTDTSKSSGKKSSRLTPTPTPTAEELETEALRSYERFQSAVNRIFEGTLRHRAFVTSTGGKEEGVFGSAGETRKAVGLILGKDSRRLFILLDHLPEGKKHQAEFFDSSAAPAKVFASDPSTGLTILAVQLRDLETVTLAACTPAELGNSYSLHRGELVLAVGTMPGEAGEYMRGTILSTERPYNVPDREYRLLTTDIPGAEDAAGFLVDTQGRVVGIFSDRFTPEGTNLISALPISMVKTLLTNMMNRENLVSLGIMGRDISAEESASLGVPAGIYVLYALEESAALEAGIRTGDVITGINGKEITSLLLLEEELYRHEPGDSLTVTLMRLCPEGYEEVSCEVILSILENHE